MLYFLLVKLFGVHEISWDVRIASTIFSLKAVKHSGSSYREQIWESSLGQCLGISFTYKVGSNQNIDFLSSSIKWEFFFICFEKLLLGFIPYIGISFLLLTYRYTNIFTVTL